MIIAIASGLLMLYSILLLYFKIMWDLLPEQKLDPAYKPNKQITVIIPARNEEASIGRLLRSIEKQSYPQNKFEVIVVDDFSEDRTAEVVQSFTSVQYVHLSECIDETFTNSYKKKAISEAVKRAKGDLIVTTDADCEVGQDWLRSIAQANEKDGLVALSGPVIFFKKNSLLNIFQELDFIAMQGITAAVLMSKKGAMSNGANFTYTKEAFSKVNGYDGIDHLASGDDMMLMHKFQQVFPDRLGFLKNPAAIVQTKAMESIPAFLNQRIRWAGKNKSLSDFRVQIILLLSWLMNASLLLAMLSLFQNFDSFLYVILLLIIKGIAEYFFSADVARFFSRKNRLPFLFILQPLHIFYMTFVGFLGMFNTYTWKNRKVK